jgi:hypothetical protein
MNHVDPLFVGIVVSVFSFAMQYWLIWKFAKQKAAKEEIECLRKEVVELQTEVHNVVTYLKMKNGDIAREVL